MAEPDEPFVWINSMGDVSGWLMRVYFGKSPDDPMPFILTVTAAYVAHKIQKTLPLTIQDLQNYCDAHREELRQIALRCKQGGRTTETLT
jgi:hypothetical protein